MEKPPFQQYRYSQSSLNRPPYTEPMARPRYVADSHKQHHRFRTFIICLVVLVIAGVGALRFNMHHSLATSANHTVVATVATKKQITAAQTELANKTSVFDQQVTAIIAANPAITFSITTYTPEGGTQTLGTTTTFLAASTGKLLTAGDYLLHVQNGTASLNTMIDGETANYWMELMIVNSDDNAWAELNGYLGNSDLSAYASSLGITDYDVTNNELSSPDIALVLQKLYGGQLVNSSNRSLLLGYLKQANYRQYIVPAVPANDTIYHKIGLYEDNVHDAAIITNGSKYLVLVIFTNGNGTYDWTARAAMMQSITKDALAAYLS